MKKNIVIIVLAILVLCLGGYLVYDKVLSSDDNKIENNEVKEEKENLKNDLAKILVDDIVELDVYNIFERLSKSGLSEELKLSMAISYIEPVNVYTCIDAFDINFSVDGYRPSENERWGCYQNENVKSYSYGLVNKEYKNLFGSLEDAPKISILKTWVYDYSNKIDSYVSLNPYFGPIVGSLYYYEIENIYVEKEQLKIEIAYLNYIPSSLGESDTFRYTLNDINYTNKSVEEIKQAYYDNKNLLPHLTFNYAKENGRYILKSVN